MANRARLLKEMWLDTRSVYDNKLVESWINIFMGKTHQLAPSSLLTWELLGFLGFFHIYYEVAPHWDNVATLNILTVMFQKNF